MVRDGNSIGRVRATHTTVWLERPPLLSCVRGARDPRDNDLKSRSDMETVRQRRMGTPGTGLLPPSTVSSEDIDVAWELARLGELHCVPEASTSSAEWHESLDSDAAAQDATIGAVSRTSSMFSRRTTANPSPQAKAHRATPCPHGKARSYYCRGKRAVAMADDEPLTVLCRLWGRWHLPARPDPKSM